MSEVINFTRGVPADESFPLDQLAECASAVLTGPLGVQVMQYGKSTGFPPTPRGGGRATWRGC
ncbi:MAG: hypothetical protein Q9O62_08985 [Ardenticatenia bacterium]|nr:hypothetical protein [Ardenticatenia bacterium]